MRRSGFTLIDLLVVLIVVAFVAGVIFIPMTARRGCCGSRPIKDSTQIRGIHQGMVLWAQNNNDVFPLPSLADPDNSTIALPQDTPAAAKNTTANIVSLMIYQGFFSPEICVSPAEANSNIKVFDKYQYSVPSASPDPAKALWDPAFPTDFSNPARPGSFSYAHMLPAESRLRDQWHITFQASEAAIGNRGPEVSFVAKGRGQSVTQTVKNKNSNTFLIHGGRTTWEGNVAYNDNHVNFETRMDPETLLYRAASGKQWFDTLFYDEPDDATNNPAANPPTTAHNAFLGNFIDAGSKSTDFVSIWD
ncbi:hypothetical protein PHYC_02398 [Phycisphaerales bacterium]|nr:hypothetical protein PHYC_02398 [Phycisphaerales bacterium]